MRLLPIQTLSVADNNVFDSVICVDVSRQVVCQVFFTMWCWILQLSKCWNEQYCSAFHKHAHKQISFVLVCAITVQKSITIWIGLKKSTKWMHTCVCMWKWNAHTHAMNWHSNYGTTFHTFKSFHGLIPQDPLFSN